MTSNFAHEVSLFISEIEGLSNTEINTSQIWSLDSQGFHIIWDDGDNKSIFREIARQTCLQSQAILADTVVAYPFRFSEKQSGAIVVKFEQPCTHELFESIEQFIQNKFPLLEKIMADELLVRLSGSAKRADWLGRALSLAYDIENSSNVTKQYAQIHDALTHVMYAKNLFVAILDPTRKLLNFEYLVDEHDDHNNTLSIPLHEGVLQGSLTAYVVKTGKLIRGDSIELLKEVGFDEAGKEYGKESHDWIGVPLVIGREVYGAIVVQIYDKSVSFVDSDPNLLAVLAEAIASSLQQKQVRKKLEHEVTQRTAELANSNEQLKLSIKEMRALQTQLIESEKQASLGRLVSGVAHELNTPLGVSMTANSVIADITTVFAKKFESNALTKNEMSGFLQSLSECSEILSTKLTKASELVERFKEITDNQQAERICRFKVKSLTDSIIQYHQLVQSELTYQLHIICSAELEVHTYQTLVKRVIGQLIENSIKHGFSHQQKGQINIDILQINDMVVINYRDNGAGVDPALFATIFDPFVTTNRIGGSVGIGLHIVSNIVTQTLKGELYLDDKFNHGFKLQIKFPADRRFDESIDSRS